LLAVVLCVGAFFLYTPARMWALVTLGRASGCTLERALQIQKRYSDQTAIKDRLISESRIIQNDGKGFKLYQTPYGPYWIPVGSEFVLPFNLAEQEMKIYGTGARDVQPGDVVLDCGANVGVYTREALKQGARLVVAIEPAPENIECLRRNFEKEIAEGKVVIYPKGVWDKDDMLELMVDPQNSAADSFIIRREGAKAVAKVPLTTIDKMVDELKLEKVDYIKMDIEGAEVKALEGGRKTLERFHPRMALSVYHQADHPVEVPRAARAAWAGYHTECGPCAEIDKFTLRPDVLFFY
jgi:FkbM family methyltransferase